MSAVLRIYVDVVCRSSYTYIYCYRHAATPPPATATAPWRVSCKKISSWWLGADLIFIIIICNTFYIYRAVAHH